MTDDTKDTGTADTVTDTSTAAADANSTTSTETVEGQGQGEAGKTGEAATEVKTDEVKTEEEATPEGAPEKYEDFTLPEGFALDGERLEQAHAFAKANNWTQDQAQQGVETYIKLRADEREYERGAWAVESEKEYGDKFAGIAKGAQAAIVEMEKVRPGITDRLDATNLGNHPDILYVFSLLGERGKESGMHGLGGDTAAGHAEPKSAAAILYPNDVKK